MKPANQMCEGRQYSDTVAGENYVTTTRDQYDNEIPESADFHHTGSTPGIGSFNWSADHYNDDVKSGSSVKDLGQSPSKESVGVNAHAADRGKES